MKTRIIELVEKLNLYRDTYYNQNRSMVSDAEYDKLFDELTELEKESEYVLTNSPTQTVGYNVVSSLNKVQHSIPLLSLDKTKYVDDIIKFADCREIVVMHKLDGLTVELIYDNGKFVSASTRGNGIEGEDITHNIQSFKNVPLTIPYKGYLKVSGEAIIHINDFEKINNNLPDGVKKYKTPRNLASGSVRQLDSKICAEREIYFYAYNLLEGRLYELDKPITKYDDLRFLGECGFWLVYHSKLNKNSTRIDYKRIIKILQNIAKEDSFPIDGLVFAYDDIVYGESLGATSHHPLHSIAFKFEDETETTTLREIEWSMGRTGVLTPVAIFDTVELDGTEVSRASLHNVSIIENLQLGIGDEIKVYKANMIIPQILESVTKSGKLPIPDICPVCGGNTEIVINESKEDGEVKIVKVLTCANPNCKGKILSRFSHFVSKNAMNIDGLSEATLEKFITLGWINDFDDIYSLSDYMNAIVKMDGFGKRSYEKLIDSIEKSKNVKLENFIYALGIPLVGRTASKNISKHFKSDIEEFSKAMEFGYDFTEIDDIGELMNKSLNSYFSDTYKYLIFLELQEILTFIKSIEVKTKDNPFKDKTVVITGSFENFTRTSIQEKFESLGAKVSGSVSKKTDYLICGTDAGSKLTKAKELGVRVIEETELMGMVG